MNLTLAKQILKAVEAEPDGYFKVYGRKMRHEAKLMQEAGWLKLTRANGTRSAIMARVTETGHRVSRLFRDDAVTQRLHDVFMPRRAAEDIPITAQTSTP